MGFRLASLSRDRLDAARALLVEALPYDRVGVVAEHLTLKCAWLGERRGVLEMRRMYGGYFKGHRNASQLRARLMELEERDERGRPLQGGYCFPQSLLDARRAKRHGGDGGAPAHRK